MFGGLTVSVSNTNSSSGNEYEEASGEDLRLKKRELEHNIQQSMSNLSPSKEVSGCLPLEQDQGLEVIKTKTLEDTYEDALSVNNTEDDPYEDYNAYGWNQVWDRFVSGQDNEKTMSLLKQWVSLPTIAVLGDTSCGKSSLLSQLSGIELPSSNEITTKCPLELSMKFNEIREANIGIEWKGKGPRSPKRHQSQYEGLWDERSLRTVDEWKEIPNIIRQAQQTILKQQQVENGPHSTTSTSTVSSHTIKVSLTGPLYPAQQTLTLVDLPGLVQRHNAQTESPTVSLEITKLLQPYLENEHCLLVAVLPANVDYHNAHVLQLAGKHDPKYQRTLPVWTKPDLIDKGAEQSVAELMENAQGFLNCRNVHMVKCRGQAALDEGTSSLSAAILEEERYFQDVAPWNQMDSTLFGTSNLQKKLVQLQAKLIADTLPKIVQEIQSQLVMTEKKLNALGGRPLESAGERRHHYQVTCHQLLSRIQTSLSGKGNFSRPKKPSVTNSMFGPSAFAPPPPPPRGDSFHSNASSGNGNAPTLPPPATLAANRLHQACNSFTNQIKQGSLATIRSVVEGAHVLVTSARGTVRGEVVHIDHEEGFCCVDMNPEDRSASAVNILFEFTEQPLEDTSVEENDVWSDGSSVFIARRGGVYDGLRKIPLDCVWTDPTTWLQSHMDQFRTDDLACFLNVESFGSIVQEFMNEDWKPACETLLDQMKSILQQALSQALEEAISVPPVEGPRTKSPTGSSTSSLWADAPPRFPGLKSLLQRHLRQVSDALVHEASLQVESHLAMEAHPFTQDEALFERMNRARYSRLKRELEVGLMAEQSSSEGQARVGKLPLSKGGISIDAMQTVIDDVFSRQEKMSVQEHQAFEMEIVLEAYGEIATRRVQDRTPMICWQVFRTFTNLLSNRLAAVTDHDLNEAMSERSSFAKEYYGLVEKRDKLKESILLLESL